MSSAVGDHIPTRNKAKIRASAAAKIDLACSVTESYSRANSPSRRQRAATLQHASSSSSLRAMRGAASGSPQLQRKQPRARFGSSASFDGVLDRTSSPLQSGTNEKPFASSRSKNELMPDESTPQLNSASNSSRHSPSSEVLPFSPRSTASSLSTTGQSRAIGNNATAANLATTNSTASSSAVKNYNTYATSTSAAASNSSNLSGEDRAARFVNRLTLDLCANSSLFSDVCEPEVFQEQKGVSEASSNDVLSPQAPGVLNAGAADFQSNKPSQSTSSSANAEEAVNSQPRRRPTSIDSLKMKTDQGRGSSSDPTTPGKEPVLSPKDGMMFSYFDVPVTEAQSSSERKQSQAPLAPMPSERGSSGLFRRTLCVNTSTVSPVLDTATSIAGENNTRTSSSSGAESTDGVLASAPAAGSSTSRGNSLLSSEAASAVSSPAKTPSRKRHGSLSSESASGKAAAAQPVQRSNSTRRLASFFVRVFRRQRTGGREEEEEGFEASAFSTQFSGGSPSQNGDSAEQDALHHDQNGELETLDGAMRMSCPSLGGKISLTDSAALSCTTPELISGGQEPTRGSQVRKSLERFRILSGRRSNTPVTGDRVASPGSEYQSDVDVGVQEYKRACATPEYSVQLAAIPQSPPEHGQFSAALGADGCVDTHNGSVTIGSRNSLGQAGLQAETVGNPPPLMQGTVTVLPAPHKALRSSLVSLPSQSVSTSEIMGERDRQLSRRISGDLHDKTVNSVSPKSESPVSTKSDRSRAGSVVVRDVSQRYDPQQRFRKTRSVEEETIAAAVAEARGKMQKKEFDALSGMLSPDSKGRLVPKYKDWSVSMDHLEQQPAESTMGPQSHVLSRRLSSQENKMKPNSPAAGSLGPPSPLNNEETRHISRSLSSVLFKRKSASIRSSVVVEGVPEGQLVVKVNSTESLNSPAKSLASGTSDLPPKHFTVANPSDASSDYFPAFGPSPLAATSMLSSAPPRIAFHPPNKPRSEMTHEDLRKHVVHTLLEAELKYGASLRTLMNDYFAPLKRNNLIDAALVDEIFFQIPAISLCHKRFNHQLRERADKWHSETVFGDIFLQSFSNGILSHAYTAYINHFIQIKDTLRIAMAQKPAFAKFLEQVSRESEDKLTLSDLLIMPVQRIPRYVLILKDLLKHCPVGHPDHGSLLLALEAMCSLAEKMNRSEEQATNLELLKELEFSFNGVVPGLVAPHRQLVRKDRVSEVIGNQTKDRLMIMLNDVLLCATVRRRTGSKKGTGHASLMSSGDANVRYKLMWRAMVKDISVFQTPEEIDLDFQAKQEIELLEKDLILLSDISLKCENLVSPHQELYQSINSMIKTINDGIQGRKSLRELATLTLTVDNKRGHTSQHVVVFQTSEEKNSWLEDYRLTKSKIDEPNDGRDSWHRSEGDTGNAAESASLMSVSPSPRFLDTIQMMKTRSGMQITCACPSTAPSHLTPTAISAKANGQLWVCASDGNVGQVCMVNTEKLTLRLTACITVCDSRITCIIAVPEYIPPDIQRLLAQRERRKMLAEHHLSYDSESENENETSGEERSLHDPSSKAVSPETSHRPVEVRSSSAVKDGVVLRNHQSLQHTMSDTAVLKSSPGTNHSSPLMSEVVSISPSPKKATPKRKFASAPGAFDVVEFEADNDTPVPSSPANFLRETSQGSGDADCLPVCRTHTSDSSHEAASVGTLRASGGSGQSESAQTPLRSVGVKTSGETSSASSSSVTSPADDETRGILRAPGAVSSPGRRRSGSGHADDGEVFVAPALASRVRHFNSLAVSGDSPDVTRAANTPKATSTADLVDSGIIPTGDEASASSQGSVSRSASDVSSKSNSGLRPPVLEKTKAVAAVRSKSMSERRTARVNRSLSHSVMQTGSCVQPRISAGHLILSQQTNNLPADGKRSMDHDPTMWLGTENGLLYIYRAGDSIRMRQRRTVLRFKAGVVKLCHTGSCVYVSMKDGHLIVFCRTAGGDWDTRDPVEVITNLPGSVVTSMAVVDGEVWCACRDRILIIGKDSCFIRKSVTVGNDPSAKVSHIACIGLCVYVAMETGGVIHCYNAASQEYLFSMDTMASVAQMLTGCDTIIRQHKINCLRITALESYRGLIWAGTSAGIVLTIQNLPTITKETKSKDILDTPHPQASYNGHTGPVRFITATERMSKTPLAKSISDSKVAVDSMSRHSTSELPPSASSSVQNTPLHSAMSPDYMPPDLAQYVAKTDVEALVVTGGDGFEDFKASLIGDNDDFAQDDSSSHLHIWQTT